MSLKELTLTVSRLRGSHNPSRVFWIGRLPTRISWTALKFLQPTRLCHRRLYVSDRVRFPVNRSLTYEITALIGFANVDFESVEEALRMLCQGALHVFRYR